MRLLVTSPHRGAGYAIATALRPYCERLIVNVSAGRPAFAASRLYDRAVKLAPPRDTWIGAGDTQDARLHADRLLQICMEERIGIVWPSNDAEMFVLSAAKPSFAAAGICIMAPDYEVLRRISDKFEIIRAAQAVGFPVAEARLCENAEEVEEALSERSFPIVVKGRWSTASLAVSVAYDRADARKAASRLLVEQGAVILQDYIAGRSERSLHYVISADKNIARAFSLRKHRHLAPSYSTAVEIVEPPPELEAGGRLLAHLGFTGFCVIQTRIDARDGLHKIIEINTRFGTNSRILFTLDPMLAHLATLSNLGSTDPELFEPLSIVGRKGSSPVEDLMSVWSLILAKSFFSGPSRESLPRFTSYLKTIARFYRTRPAVDLHTRALLADPFAAIPYFLGLARFLVPTKLRIAGLRLVAWD